MACSKFATAALLAVAAVSPGPAAAAMLLEGALGLQFYGFHEKDAFSFPAVEGEESGRGPTYQLSFGGHGERAAIYGTYIRSSFPSDKPTSGGGDVQKSVSFLGAGLKFYLAANPAVQRTFPYLLGGGGLLFHSEDGVYMGRGAGFFGGLGIRLVPHLGVEGRYFGGSASETDRTFHINAFQLVMVLSTY